ncbi:MAG: ABC-F family ATP-binding cassette domain-containing protein, partial [Clostridia bacterium]|nr:ABC-F family ATP-binding cassette domain-containing protein [Clostridia bacterium]
MFYKITDGFVGFGGEYLLNDVNFEIREGDKIALVGRNGSGKTTLLKAICGELEIVGKSAEEEPVSCTGNPEIGYLKQLAFEDDSVSMEDEIKKAYAQIIDLERRMALLLQKIEREHNEDDIREYSLMQDHFTNLGGYYYERECHAAIRSFGFTDEDKRKPLSDFSGGQRTKIALIKLLLSKPDILILDEPTNHLDITTISWLEEYIISYKKSVVIVSHDRMFLDKTVSTVYEIERGRVTRYKGNYTEFARQKQERWESQRKEYTAQQKEIARLKELVERFRYKPTKAAMAQSKLKQIERMEIVPPPESYDLRSFQADFSFDLKSGNDVLTIRGLKIGYDRELSEVTADIKLGDKVGIIGGNGLGKSTFLKTITGALRALGGEYRYGVNVNVGYFDQQTAQYASTNTVLDELWNEFPEMTQTQVRSALGAFLFTQDDVFKTVDMLSGGEKVRLALCRMLKRKPNVLILDEPTNHMDIVGKEALEAILKRYEGTVLFVSHDRYFVQQIAQSLLVFEQDRVTYY